MDNEQSFAAPAQDTAPAPEPAPAASSSQPDTSSSAPSTNTSSTQDRSSEVHFGNSDGGSTKDVVSAGGMKLVTDQFGRRKIEFVKEEDDTQDNAQDNQPQQPSQPQQQFTQQAQQHIDYNADSRPPVYTLHEFSNAIATGRIDERRIPMAYKEQYENFRINQAVREFNNRVKAQEQAQAREAANVQEQLSPEEQSKNIQEFYTSLEKEAIERAAKDVGFTQDDLENIPYMDEDDQTLINFKTAKDWHKAQIMNTLQRRAQDEAKARANQEAIYNDISSFVDNARATEPNFRAIDIIMENRYKQLPYISDDPRQLSGMQVGQAIESLKNGTINSAQANVLQRYYESCRLEYYARRNGLQTSPQRQAPKPPVVENAGDGRSVDTSYTPDFGKLRNADVRGRREWVAEYLRNRNR